MGSLLFYLIVAAALLAFVGSVLAKLVIAAGTTAGEFDTSTIAVLRAVTTMTWPVFFAEAMTAADWVFAAVAAGLAAFFASRRLNRREYQALRIWQEKERREKNGDEPSE